MAQYDDLSNQAAPEMSRRCAKQPLTLAPIAELCASYSELLLKSLRGAARVLLEDLAPHGTSIPFTQFAAAWRRRFATLPPAPEAEALRQRLTELVAPHSAEAICRISAAELLDQAIPATEPAVLSPDLLLAAPCLEDLAHGRYAVPPFNC